MVTRHPLSDIFLNYSVIEKAPFLEPFWQKKGTQLFFAGAELSEGRGSRVRVYLNKVRAVFHRPHPRKETDKGAVKSMRRFLTEAGFGPEE
jgi:hypothetical protein